MQQRVETATADLVQYLFNRGLDPYTIFPLLENAGVVKFLLDYWDLNSTLTEEELNSDIDKILKRHTT